MTAFFASAPRHPTYDVTIIGAGIMGASTAFHLASNHAFSGRVLVLERDPSFATAATTHTNSCIREQFSTEVNIRMSQFGLAYLRDFAGHTGCADAPSVHLNPFGYMYLAATNAGVATLRANVAVQHALGAKTRLLSPHELASEFPFIQTSDILLASWNPGNEGYFDGAGMYDFWKQMARSKGVEFVGANVDAITRIGDDWHVTMRGTTVTTGQLVNAAGPRSGEIARMAGIDLPVEPRRRFTWVIRAETPLPRDLPLTIDPSGVHMRSDGANYMIGAAPEPDETLGPTDFRMDDIWLDRIWPLLANRVPAFEKIRVMSEWVGHYDYNTFDQNAVIGPHPDLPGLWFITGFSGHGLQHAAAAGNGLAERIAHGHYQTIDLTPLGFDRILAGRPLRELGVI